MRKYFLQHPANKGGNIINNASQVLCSSKCTVDELFHVLHVELQKEKAAWARRNSSTAGEPQQESRPSKRTTGPYGEVLLRVNKKKFMTTQACGTNC